MPTLADELDDWYRSGQAPQPAPRTMTELVQQLGGPGRGGGVRAAAQFLGVNPRTGNPYTERAVQRYLRGEAGLGGETRPTTQIEGPFNRAVAALVAGRDRPINVTITGPRIRVSDTEEDRPRRSPVRTLTPITPRELAPVMRQLARGRADRAAARFGQLVLEHYGIPQSGEILEIDAMTIRRA